MSAALVLTGDPVLMLKGVGEKHTCQFLFPDMGNILLNVSSLGCAPG